MILIYLIFFSNTSFAPNLFPFFFCTPCFFRTRSKTPAEFFEDTLRTRTAPPIQIGGMHVQDDPTLKEAVHKVKGVLERTKPWMQRLVGSFSDYVQMLYDSEAEIELRHYLDAFLHDSSATTAAAMVPGELGGKTAEGALFSHKQKQKETFDLSLEGITFRIEHYLTLADAAVRHCEHVEHLPNGIIVVKCQRVQKQLQQRALELAGVLLNGCQQRLLGVCTDLDREYYKIEAKIKKPPTCSQDVFDARKYAKEVETIHLPRLGVAFHHPQRGVKRFLLLLQGKFGHRIRFKKEETELVARVYQWPGHLENSVMVLAAGVVDMYAQKQVNVLSLERIDLEKDLRQTSGGVRSMRKRDCRILDASMLPKRGVGLLEVSVPVPEMEDPDPDPAQLLGWASFVDASGPASVGGAVLRAASLRNDLQRLSDISNIIAAEELRLGQPDSGYGYQVTALGKALSNYEGAWGDLRAYLVARDRVYGHRITTLDAAWEHQQWKGFQDRMVEWLKHDKLRDAVPLKAALKAACSEIETFLQEHVELLTMLATDGLESRHWWDTMGRLILDDGNMLHKAPVFASDDDPIEINAVRTEKCLGEGYQRHRLTLATLLDCGVQNSIDSIAALCHRAKEQRKLELELDAMAALWHEMSLAWLEFRREAPKKPQKAWVSAKAKVKQQQEAQKQQEAEQADNARWPAALHSSRPVVEVTWRSITAVESLIEEQLTRVKMLQASPFVGPHLRRCYQWETRLDSAELVMNEWWELQTFVSKMRRIMGLAVFADGAGTEEERLGQEYRRLEYDFITMQMDCEEEGETPTKANGNFGTYVSNDTIEEDVELRFDISPRIQAPSLRILGGIITLARLRRFSAGLEKIRSQLRRAVDKRCETFPRLWLQSEDQIFQLLVDARDKQQVQRHISSLFPGVRGIMFGSGEAEDASTAGYIDAGDITAVYCDDGEMVGIAKRPAGQLVQMRGHLQKVLDPEVWLDEQKFEKILLDKAYINPEGQRSPVELWMLQLETEIRRTVFAQIDGAVRQWPKYDLEQANRGRKVPLTAGELLDRWVRRWPMQALHASDAIHWANGVERILRRGLPIVETTSTTKSKNNKRRGSSKPGRKPWTDLEIRHALRKMLSDLRARLRLYIQGVHSYQTTGGGGGGGGGRDRGATTAATTAEKEKRWRVLSKYTSFIVRTRHREHVMEEMLKDNANDSLTFFWLAQMRHHFVPNTGRDKSVPGVTSIRVFGTSILHGGEMFGARGASSIVVTPLTERCYRAILLSLSTQGAHGGSGAVLNGPPGMGKTETMRMCALECGVSCPVLNGSERIDGPTGMVRMIRAATGSGATWLLLDNIGRVPMAVLSVVGHALATLRRSIIAGKTMMPGGEGGYRGGEADDDASASSSSVGDMFFEFNGRKSIVKPGGKVVATVDHDHEERSEKSRKQLPENLSLFFRPCTLLSFGPLDLQRVAEITLLSGGFRCSERLARRLTTLHTCAGQLLGGAGAGEEHQQHYDYSLRSLIMALREATELLQSSGTMRSRTRSESAAEETKLVHEGGEKEREYEQAAAAAEQDDAVFASERSIMATAWRRIHDPQLTDALDRARARRLVDEILLHGAESIAGLGLAKGRVTLSVAEMRTLRKACTDNFVVPEPSFLGTVVDLHNTLRSRTGTLVLGASNSGKSCAIKLLARASPALAKVAPKRMLSTYGDPELHIQQDGGGGGGGGANTSESDDDKGEGGSGSSAARQISHIVPFVLNPMALTVEALFGNGTQPTSIDDPRGGLLRHTLLRCIESGRRDPYEMQWIIFDGPIDASWIEGMTTMFDASRSLCLPTGETIPVPTRCKLLFEACSVANATPGAISRIGVVSIGQDVLSWRSLLRMWVRFFEARHHGSSNISIEQQHNTGMSLDVVAVQDEESSDTLPRKRNGKKPAPKGNRRKSIQFPGNKRKGLKGPVQPHSSSPISTDSLTRQETRLHLVEDVPQAAQNVGLQHVHNSVEGVNTVAEIVKESSSSASSSTFISTRPQKKTSPLDRWKKAALKFAGSKKKGSRRGSVAAIGNSAVPSGQSQANRDHAAEEQSSSDSNNKTTQGQQREQRPASPGSPKDSQGRSMRPGAHLTELFEAWLEPCVGLLQGPLARHCFGNAVNALSFTRGTLHVLDVLLDPTGEDENASLHDTDDDSHRRHFDAMFLCALTCAIGAYIDAAGRHKFSELCASCIDKGTWFGVHAGLDQWLKDVAKWQPDDVGGHRLGGDGWPVSQLKSGSTIFELYYDANDRTWKKWLAMSGNNGESLSRMEVASRPVSAQSYNSRRSRPGTANSTGSLSREHRRDIMSSNFTTEHWAKHSRRWGAIFVPTSETVGTEFWAERLLRRGCPVLFCGPTGAGKTALAHRVMLTLENEQGYARSIEMHFAIDTGAHQLQKLVDRRMQRRKRGFYEPAHGKPGVLFVDDVHAPSAPETSGTSAGRATTVEVVELMRQLVSNGGWYDLDTMDFRRMQKLTLFAATTDARAVSHRFTHHLVPLALVGLDDPGVLISVFHRLLGGAPGPLSPPSLVDMVAAATLDVYTSLSRHLRPTPVAPHYVFSARDVGSMLEGIKLATTGAGEDPIYQQKGVVIRLWAHEVMRVFHDRLVNDEDRMWLLQLIKKTTEVRFEQDFDALLAHLDTDGDGQIDEDELLSLHFCSLARSDDEVRREKEDDQAARAMVQSLSQKGGKGGKGGNMLAAAAAAAASTETTASAFGLAAAKLKKKDKEAKILQERRERGENVNDELVKEIVGPEEVVNLGSGRAYRERPNPEHLLDLLSSKSEDYDQEARKYGHRPMKLVVFHYAVEHLCRILRVLDFEAGHMILVGHGGSGRQSLSRLATFCAGHRLMHAHDAHEYDWARWRRELWQVLETASTEPVVFLVTQAHLRFDGMLSDLAAIVRGGDVSSLAPDPVQQHAAGTASRPRTAGTTTSSINSYATPLLDPTALRANLHVIICLSPAGPMFRDTIRRYQSIRNHCTIDWFGVWPMEALSAVARGKLDGLELDIADVAAKRRLSAAAANREALRKAKIHFKPKRKTRQELRRSFRRGLKMQKMLGMMKMNPDDIAPVIHEKGEGSGEGDGNGEGKEGGDGNGNGDKATTREGRAVAFETERRAKLKAETKRRIKKLQTASLLSGIYFKSKNEQMVVLFEAIVETALVVHVQAREAAEVTKSNGGGGGGSTRGGSKSHHVMPAKFLEFLECYVTMLQREQDRVLERKHRFEVGVQKLGLASAEVTEMNTQIMRMTPMLQEAQATTKKIMERLDQAKPIVKQKRAVVRMDEKRATKEAEKVARTKLECEEDLKVALPMLDEAMAALDTIKPKDITNLKGMSSPPEGVKLVLEAVCVMLQVDPKKKTDKGSGEFTLDYWKPSQKIMGKSKFLDRLRNYDKDNIPTKIVKTVRETYIPMEAFTPEIVKRASSAAEGMCKWVLAIIEYDRVLNFIRPKRKALAESEQQLQNTLKMLGAKRRALVEVEGELQALQDEYDAAVERKDRLIKTLELCELKVERARHLLQGLGGEADKWTESAHELSIRSTLLVGDMLLGAAVVTYTGIMSGDKRRDICKKWTSECRLRKMPLTKSWSLRAVLGRPERDREWVARGLPDDDYHIENAIMVEEALRFPLMIDPQGQARRWVRSAFRDAGVKTTMLSDASFEATISSGIVRGHPVLLENMDEHMDALHNTTSGGSSSGDGKDGEDGKDGKDGKSLFEEDQQEELSNSDKVKASHTQMSSQGGERLLSLPPELEPILLHQLDKAHRNRIHWGDSVLECHNDFKLFLATKRANPHFPPGVVALVTILDFSMTPAGLEHVLLSDIVRRERSDLEDKSGHVRLGLATCGVRLENLEREILRVMAASEGNLLEDENAINTLKSSQEERDEVLGAQASLEAEMIKLEKQRQPYRGLAAAVSPTFFLLQDMARIRSIYQYSLPLFMEWFGQAIRESQHTDKIARRVNLILQEWTRVLLDNATASFFERDENIFLLRVAMVWAAKRSVEEGDTAGSGSAKGKSKGGKDKSNKSNNKSNNTSKNKKDNSKSGKKTDAHADDVHSLGRSIRATCKAMEKSLSTDPQNAAKEMPDVAISIAENLKGWEDYWSGKTRSAPIKGLTPFKHLLAVRLFGSEERLPDAVFEFCRQELGSEAVQPRTVDLKDVLRSSNCATPIVLFAEPGSSIDISPLARAHRKKVHRIPMGGKNEGDQAMAAIHSATKAGEWVLLEGIHLCGPFLSHLSRVMEDIVEAGEEVARKKDAKQLEAELERVHLSPKAAAASGAPTSGSGNGSGKPSFSAAVVTTTTQAEEDDKEEAKKRKQRGKRRGRRGRRTSSSAMAAEAMQAVFQLELAKDNFRVRGPIHKSFRLWCVTRPVERHFPVSMLQESVCVVIEAVTGLRSNALQSLGTVPLSQREFWSVEREENGEDGDGARSTRLFELIWFHALSVSRGTFGALGYSGGPYVLTAGLELGLGVKEMEMVHERVLDYKDDPDHANGGISLLRDADSLTELAGRLVTDIHYGGHVGDPEDRIILGALWELSRDAAKKSLGSDAEGYRSLDQHRMFVRGLAPEPVLPGLATDAVIARRVVESAYLMERFYLSINTDTRRGGSGGSGSSSSGSSGGTEITNKDKDKDKTNDTTKKGAVSTALSAFGGMSGMSGMGGGMVAAAAAAAATSVTPFSSTSDDDAAEEDADDIEDLLRDEHVVEWTAAFPMVRDQIIQVVGTEIAAREALTSIVRDIARVTASSVVALTQFDRVVQRERIALARLRLEIAIEVGLWIEIMEGRLDSRHRAHVLEVAVSSYEAPHRWREWGGDWILASEMSEFLQLLESRQEYWRNTFVEGTRKVWWGALSRPASLLGVVVFDSGHSFELGGLGDVVGRVYGHDQLEGGEEELEEGAVVTQGVWLIGCHIVNGHIVDGGGSAGKVRAPDIVLRRRHVDDVINEDDIQIPCYAHRGSSVLLNIPLRQAHTGDDDRKEKAFWSLRGVKLLVQ